MPRMATKKRAEQKRGGGRPPGYGDYDVQLTIRLPRSTVATVDELLTRVGLGTRIQVLREAIVAGLPLVIARYEAIKKPKE